jgi:radical SAM superfamily enzyme YgiQ (UPF0313 family)
MRVTLLYTPSTKIENSDTSEVVQRHFGCFPHLGLATIAAALEQAGHRVQFLDAPASGLSLNKMLSAIRRFKPGLIGYSAATNNFPNVLFWINKVHDRFPDIPAVVGGPHLSYYPMESLVHKSIDFAAIGDGTETVVELAGALESGRGVEDVKGIAWKSKGRIIMNRPRPLLENLDLLPLPARHLLPNEKYFNFLSRRKNFSVLYTEAGCPGRCIFCDIGRAKFRFKSSQRVLEELEECYHKFRVREFQFYDGNFVTNKKRVVEICRGMRERGLDMLWSVEARADMVNREILLEMKKAGCYRIQYGIETGNARIMETIKKMETKEQIEAAVRLTKKLGISVLGFFMLGLPGETEETMEETVRFMLSLPLDYASIALTRSYPNTEMYEAWMRESGWDFYKKYTTGEIPPDSVIPLYNTKLSIQRVQQKVDEAYFRFFFRPVQALRVLRDIRSLEQLKKYTAATCDMVKSAFLTRGA